MSVYARIGVEQEQVMVLFSEDPEGSHPAPIDRWMIDPAQCLDIVEAMAKAAFEADTKLKPVGDTAKASIVERHRMTLTARVALMMGTLRGNKLKSDGEIARDIVDVCLAEVF